MKRRMPLILGLGILGLGLSLVEAPREFPSRVISIKDEAEMILIPEGDFIYGIEEQNLRMLLDKLAPQKTDLFKISFHKQVKHLPSYYIDKYEVTNEQYMRFVKAAGHRKPAFWGDKRFNHPRQPVVGVGWEDAMLYAEWASKRLPTEEEWEKAARGIDGRYWPWGNEASGEKYNGVRLANWAPVEVGSFPMGGSSLDVRDMAGNVWEMTIVAGEDRGFVMRGGSYLNSDTDVLTTTRLLPEIKVKQDGAPWLGFRCVMDCDESTREKIRLINKR